MAEEREVATWHHRWSGPILRPYPPITPIKLNRRTRLRRKWYDLKYKFNAARRAWKDPDGWEDPDW